MDTIWWFSNSVCNFLFLWRSRGEQNELLNGITYWLSIGKVTALKKVKIPNKELNFRISVSVSSPMRVWNAKLLYEFYRVIISVTVEVFTTAAANRKLLKICFLPSADPWVGPCPKKSDCDWTNMAEKSSNPSDIKLSDLDNDHKVSKWQC